MQRDDGNDLKLTDLLDVRALQEIQDAFAAVTRTSVTVCDQDGRPISRPSGLNPLCRLVADSESGKHACLESLREAIRQGIKVREPVSLTCHAGLVQYAAPILVDGRLLGVIVMGDLPKERPAPEALDALAARHGIDRQAITEIFERVRPWSDEQMSAAVAFLQLLANTLARFCQQEHRLRKRIDELVTVYDITALLTGTGDLNEVLQLAARNVANVLQVKACSIRLLDHLTGELKIVAGHNLSKQYLSKGPVRVDENPIDKAALEGQIVHITDVADDPRIRYPGQAAQEGLVSGLVSGMVFRDRPVGVLRVYTGEPHDFSPFEASLLRAVAAQAASAIENRRLADQAIQSEILKRQIEIASEVQRRMIPAKPPDHTHLRFSSVYEPTYDLGGDFYDFLELPDGRIGLAIADVVGKGAPASLMMASVRSTLRVWAERLEPLDEIIGHVNRQLCRDTLPQEFATLFYGVFSPDGRQLTYCNAGHDPPMLCREDRVERLEIGGMLMGTQTDAVYESETIDLRPNDVVLFYTDGAIDAMNFVDERFGRDRLTESFVRYAALRPEAIAPNILWDVRRFIGLADQTDDITMVSAKVVS